MAISREEAEEESGFQDDSSWKKVISRFFPKQIEDFRID